MEELVYFGSNTGKTVLNSTSTEQIISCADLHSGSHVATYKKTSSTKRGLHVTQTRIYALQTDQAQLFVYNHGKESCNQKIIMPEKFSCMTVSPSESYLAAGSASGRLLIWELGSGNLIFEQETHYQGLTCLQFTQDEAFLFTGGQDARVMCWRLLDLVSPSNDNIQPVYSWADHSLGITDIQVGYGRSIEARVFTASSDQTVRVHNVATGEQLTTFVLPGKITSLCVDPAERVLYTGLEDGSIIPLNLYQMKDGVLQAVGGAKRIIQVEDAPLSNHNKAVTAMALSFDASMLVSGDEEGLVYVWDLPSAQVMRKLKQHKGPVSSIFTMVKERNSKQEAPLVPVFKRNMDQTNSDLWVQVAGSTTTTTESSMLDDLKQVSAQSTQLMNSNSQSGLQARAQQLESELETMHKHYSDIQTMHDQLWDIHVKSA